MEVPAHGTAQVKVTAEPNAIGMYSGTVIATGTKVSVRTGIGMQVEPEKRGLKLTFTGSDGKPAQNAFAGVIDLDTEEQRNYDISGGSLDLRLEKGRRYTVVTLLADQDGTVVMAADPEFTLNADRTFAAEYAAQHDAKFGEHFALPVLYGTELAWMPYGQVSRFTLPFHRTEYYTPGDTGWYPSFVQYKWPPEGFNDLDQFFFGQTTVYRAGQKTSDQWNAGVFGAGLNPDGDYSWREGDLLQLSTGLFEDGVTGRHFIGEYVAPQAKLYRDGKEIHSADYITPNIEVPADGKESEYRYTITADREPTMTTLSTRVSAEWRFRSKTPKPGKRPVLPLLAIKINPKLDDRNRAAVGHMRIPLHLQRQDGSPDLKVTTLTVEISYDDGRTWLSTLVHPSGKGDWSAETRHPAGTRGKFASLRVKAADTGGNAFTETVIRAYEIK